MQKFQFHLVRLKPASPTGEAAKGSDFNSTWSD